MEQSSEILEKPPRRFLLKPAHSIALGFLALILIGTFLLATPLATRTGKWLHFPDALFVAASAVCVTGLTTLPIAPTFNGFGQAVMLLLVQFGGLGLMTLATLMLMLLRRKITLKDRLALSAALNRNETKGIVRLVRNIILMTLVIESAGTLLLIPPLVIANGGIGVWQAVFTSVMAFCNAGFDVFGTVETPFVSLSGYVSNVTVCLTVMMLIVLGGLGFSVISEVLDNKFRLRRLSIHGKLVLLSTAALILVGFLFFVIAERNYAMAPLHAGDKILNAFFMSITCRTAGFSSVDPVEMHAGSRALMLLLMFIGASPGSTGGGVKTTTFAIFVFMLLSGCRGSDDLVILKRNVKPRTAYKATAVVFLGFALVMCLTIFLSFSEKKTLSAVGMYSIDYILFEAVSAFSTTGLTCGITPFLSTAGKIAVTLVMFVGRVGPLTIGLMFVSKNAGLIRYPDASLMIG